MLTPDDSVTKPPVAGCPPAEVDDPAAMVTLPPAPEVPDPTETEIAPPAPPVAEPVPKYKAPELPEEEVPLLNVILPLTPFVPAFNDRMTIAPLLDKVPSPDDNCREPPEAAEEAPAFRATDPPTFAVPPLLFPPETDTAPPSLAPDAPALTATAPPTPIADDPPLSEARPPALAPPVVNVLLVSPAKSLIWPPTPLSPDPTPTLTTPPRPPVAAPDPVFRAPLFPELDVPVVKTNIPEEPVVPAFTLRMNTFPLDVAMPCPDRNRMLPPVLTSDSPAKTRSAPPATVVP